MNSKRWIVVAVVSAAAAAGLTAAVMLAVPGTAIAGAPARANLMAANGPGDIALPNAAQTPPAPGPHSVGSCTETPLTGTTADKVTAAAKAAVSGATVDRVETDCDTGSPYEAHMTKSDGSHVTAYVNASFKVTKVVAGPNCPHGGRPGAGPARPGATSAGQNTSAQY